MTTRPDIPAALFHLADRLSDSAAEDRPEVMRGVMDRTADTLRMIAIIVKAPPHE